LAYLRDHPDLHSFPTRRSSDLILWYAKGTRWTFNRDDVDRIPYMAPGLVGPEKAARGKLPTDVWWLTIVPTTSRERTGYPTQKRSEEHTSELQSRGHLVCRLLL